jgi:hypothetical protein
VLQRLAGDRSRTGCANGLLVLEVKDWRLESIVSADKAKVELLTSRGIVRESSPLEQLLLEGVKDFLNVFFAMRNLRESNGIRISELAGCGEPGGLADHSAATNRCAHAGLP